MNFRGLIVAVVVLGILGGVLYWSQHRKPPENSANPSATAAPSILKINPADITQLTIRQKNGEPVTLVKAKADKWQITQPKPCSADQEAITSVLSTLSALNADRVVEDRTSDRKQYGLDPTSVEVDITGKDGKVRQLLLGDATPAGGDAYAVLAGDPRVFTIASFNKSSLDKSLNDLRDKSLLTLSPDKVSRVALMRKAQDIEFDRTKGGWQILKPSPLRAVSSAVDELVRNLTNAKMDLSGTGTSDAAAEFARATPLATAKVTGDTGLQTLEVRKSKNDYYAKSSVVDGAFKVDSSLGQALDKNLDDFRNKKLFDFGFNTPTRIELHGGADTWVFTRSGEDWSSNGKKVDAAAVESLVSKLRDLTATKFVSSGFTHPEIEATVTSDDGKQVEKVLISKSGDSSVAKRENEPDLYQLDSGAVGDLAKSAAGIKPAATAGK